MAKAESTTGKDLNFYDKWNALLKKGPTLPKEQGDELFGFIQGAHGQYQQLLAMDRTGQPDIELMNDLADEVDEQYKKYCV